MKFSCVIALSLFASVSAVEVKASNLRATAVEPVAASANIPTQVILQGFQMGTGEDHAPTLSKCYVEAYNKGDMMGFHMGSFTVDREIDIPDDLGSQMMTGGRGSAEAVFYGHGSRDCTNWRCRDVDDDAMAFTAIDFFQSLDEPSAAKLHADFEENLCACLQASGVKAYKHAKDCSVDYKSSIMPPVLAAGDTNLTVPPPTVTGVEVALKVASDKESSVLTNKDISAMVTVNDIKTGTGEDHAPTLEKCYVEAYNKRDMMGFRVGSFTVGKEVDIPKDVDSQMLTGGRGSAEAVFYGHGSRDCTNWRCRDVDDDAMAFTALDVVQILSDPSAAKLHAEFEEELCACLQASGVKAYKHAKECSVDYMYGPTPPVIEEVTPPAIEGVKTVSVTIDSANQGVESMVIVPGIKTGTGEDHAPTLEKCYVEAYNKRDMMGFHMGSFTVGKEVDIPKDVDSQMLTGGRGSAEAVFYGHGSRDCTNWRCRDVDDDAMAFTALDVVQILSDPSAAKLHAEFEEELCACLQASDVKAYKHVDNCVVQYMYGPTPPASLASQE